MRLVILGPQGSGKGTQAERLADALGLRHIATGDLVRAEIEACTAVGRSIQDLNDRGELVPDSTMVALAQPYLQAHQGWVLDGFPRDAPQARMLEAWLRSTGRSLDRVIALVAPDADLIERLLGRRLSVATGRTYHVTNDPPPTNDPGPFVRRADDTPADIARRLAIYHTVTEPLKAYYGALGLLSEVEARGAIPEVTERILRVLRDASAPEQPSHGVWS